MTTQPSDQQDQGPRRSADAVAQDVDAIFAPLRERAASAAAPPSTPQPAVRSVRPRRAARTPGRLTPAIGSGVAAILVAISAGMIWAKPMLEEQSRAAATRAVLAQIPLTAAPAAPVVPTPAVSGAPPNIAYSTTAAVGSTTPAATPPTEARVATSRAPPEKRSRASSGACSELRGHRRQACYHDRIMTADRQLRRAYARAADAGVSRPVMVAYRNRWAGLRRDAGANPGRVVRGYSVMATELSREAQAARRRRS